MQPSAALGEYTYQRHQPEDSVLYKIVQQNLETFLCLVQEETGYPYSGPATTISTPLERLA